MFPFLIKNNKLSPNEPDITKNNSYLQYTIFFQKEKRPARHPSKIVEMHRAVLLFLCRSYRPLAADRRFPGLRGPRRAKAAPPTGRNRRAADGRHRACPLAGGRPAAYSRLAAGAGGSNRGLMMVLWVRRMNRAAMASETISEMGNASHTRVTLPVRLSSQATGSSTTI